MAVNAQNRITVVLDVTHPNNNIEQFNFGAEYGFAEKVFLRGGYRTRTDEEGLTLDAGFSVPITSSIKIAVDYAYADFGVVNYV